jgi:2-phosphoglycerate kinase
MSPDRPWQVLLLGGASGVGKTQISYRLAQHFEVGLTEVDDFQVILEAMTTPEQYPVLHFWRTHREDVLRMNEDEHLEFMLSYCKVLDQAPALVIANHIESRAPIVLEGDFILPSLAVQPRYGDIDVEGQVRAVFVYEASEDQLGHNFLAREGHEQPGRAHASWRHSEWLRKECHRLGVPTMPARPWATAFERAIALVDSQNPA